MAKNGNSENGSNSRIADNNTGTENFGFQGNKDQETTSRSENTGKDSSTKTPASQDTKTGNFSSPNKTTTPAKGKSTGSSADSGRKTTSSRTSSTTGKSNTGSATSSSNRKPSGASANSSNTKSTTATSASAGKGKTTSNAAAKSSSTKKGHKTLEDLFEDNLRDAYSAETQLVAAMPAMVKAAHSEDLQDAFENHLQETKRHVERLEKVFSRLGIDKSTVEKCAAMEGLIKECKKVIEDFDESPVRDSALIICAQKVEHYEIAAYGSICELADVLGHAGTLDLLGRTLDEEENTDKDLTEIAKDINDEAYEMG